MSVAYWNGRLVTEDEVRIAPDDAGLLWGDGLFETLRADGGRPRDVAAHLDRFEAGRERLELALPESREELAARLAAVADAAPRPTARLRLTATRGTADGPTRLIVAAPYEPPLHLYREGAALVTLPDLRLGASSPLAGLKSSSYQTHRLALRRAEAAGAWDALLQNERGHVVSASRANLVLVRDGRAWTPPLADGCLPGTVRRRLLESGALSERSLTPADLAAAEEILLTNSLVGVLPVGRLDGAGVSLGATADRLRQLADVAAASLDRA